MVGCESATPLGLSQTSDGRWWFTEIEAGDLWQGQALKLEVSGPPIECVQSSFQHIQVYDTVSYGRLLVLDGVIQLTERDEAAYQEPITHLPLMAHPNPQSVAIVGGGDGGVVREIARHISVQDITHIEIDPIVVAVSKKWFGHSVATSFDDPRLTLAHEDAARYLARADQLARYDVIIVDSSDPVGPGESLFTEEFYRTLYAALRPGGIVATQGECLWIHEEIIAGVMQAAGAVFDTVDYAVTCVPTYPCGQIGFILAAKANVPGAAMASSQASATASAEPDVAGPCVPNLRMPCRAIPAEVASACRVYSASWHVSAFVLPAFAEKALHDRAGRALSQASAACLQEAQRVVTAAEHGSGTPAAPAQHVDSARHAASSVPAAVAAATSGRPRGGLIAHAAAPARPSPLQLAVGLGVAAALGFLLGRVNARK